MTGASRRRRAAKFSLWVTCVALTLFCIWAVYQLDWIKRRQEVIQSGAVIVVFYSSGDVAEAPNRPLLRATCCLWLFCERECDALLVKSGSEELVKRLFPEAEIRVRKK